MSWTCANAANQQLEKVKEHCRTSTGSSNKWTHLGRELYFAVGPTQADGAAVGRIYEDKNFKEYLVGVFRIEANGLVTAFPFLPPLLFC